MAPPTVILKPGPADFSKGIPAGYRFLRHGEKVSPLVPAFNVIPSTVGYTDGVDCPILAKVTLDAAIPNTVYLGGFKPNGTYDRNSFPTLVPTDAYAKACSDAGSDPNYFLKIPPPVAKVGAGRFHGAKWVDLRAGIVNREGTVKFGDVAKCRAPIGPPTPQWADGWAVAEYPASHFEWMVSMPGRLIPPYILEAKINQLRAGTMTPNIPPKDSSPPDLIPRYDYEIPVRIPEYAYLDNPRNRPQTTLRSSLTTAEGKKKMARKGVKSALKDGTKSAVRAAGQAAMRKTAIAATKSTIGALKGSLGDRWPAWFETPEGALFVETVAPFLLATVADSLSGQVPGMEVAAGIFGAARDAATAEVVEKAADFVIPMLQQVAVTGGMLVAGKGPDKILAAGREKMEEIITVTSEKVKPE